MSYVVVNALTVPEGAGATLEERFAARAGMVEGAEGFERFELLRPVEGQDRYLVYTRWRSKADFETWQSSRAFGAGHGQGAGPGASGAAGHAAGSDEAPRPAPAATGAELWAFEVVQGVGPTG